MSKYLKLFETTSDYETYISGGGVVLPNVSVAKDAPTTVYYSPWVEPPFFAKLTLDNGEVVELEGSDRLTSAMVTQYKATVVSAEIGELCTSIGGYVFNDCSGLTSVTIGSGVTSIGEEAFRSCTSLTSIAIPDSVTSIGSKVFESCRNLISVTIGSGVTSIGNDAFSYCSGLTSITIPNSVTSIGQEAFGSCYGLTSVTIGSGVTSIGNGVFRYCSGLTSIVVDSANTVYDSRDNCNAIINTSTNKLIAGCKNTVIPDSVTSIGSSAFAGCSNLTSITIPNSVTEIGNSAFSGCSGLTSVIIGSSVTNIYGLVFYDCSHLTSVTSLATTAPSIQSSTFQNVKTGGTLTVPNGSKGYDVWMGTGNYYLGQCGWTKVTQ